MTNTYNAYVSREGRWWVILLPELESGRATQCRRLSRVEATARDAVAVMTGADPSTIGIRVHR